MAEALPNQEKATLLGLNPTSPRPERSNKTSKQNTPVTACTECDTESIHWLDVSLLAKANHLREVVVNEARIFLWIH